MLDASYEDGYYDEPWDWSTVGALTEQWPRVVDIQNKIQNMSTWLEEDIHYNFDKLLSAVLDRKRALVPKEQLPLPLLNND